MQIIKFIVQEVPAKSFITFNSSDETRCTSTPLARNERNSAAVCVCVDINYITWIYRDWRDRRENRRLDPRM